MGKSFFTSNAYMNIKDIFVATGIFVFITVISTIIVVFALKNENNFISELMESGKFIFILYIMIFGLFLISLMIYRRLRSRHEKLDSIFKSNLFSPSILLLGVLLMIASQIVSDPFIALFPDSSKDILKTINALGQYAIPLTVLVAPLLEEFIFRGIILNDIRRSFGSFTAIIASALLFGAIHLNMAQFLPAFVIGVVFGYVYVASRSIWSVVILHMINNALAYIFHLIIPKEDALKPLSEIIQPDYIYYIIYGSSLILLLGMFVRLIFVCRADNKLRVSEVNNIVSCDTIQEDIKEENNDNNPTKLTDTSFL